MQAIVSRILEVKFFLLFVLLRLKLKYKTFKHFETMIKHDSIEIILLYVP